jgi:ATP-dependent DNA helicase UvrD/PcrA
MPSTLLSKLNPQQRRAVETVSGPVLVLAGAGTGKTRVITYRIAHLLARGIAPEKILAVTFTNKAAGEMRERVAELVGKKVAKRLTIGTFHAFCVKSLRKHAKGIGLPQGFTIADAADQIAAVKSVLRELRVPEATLHPRVVQSRVSLAKNRLITAQAYLDRAVDAEDELVGQAYRRYEEHLARSRSLDFDDLLVRMVDLLRADHEVRDQFRGRFSYLMVDEYQDTNGPQYEVVRQIAGTHRNLCVVGDDDQSIYGWRGADVSKILNFERDFPGAAVVRLETNYRSTVQILDAANRVISNNPSRHEKALRSALGDGEPVAVHMAKDEEAEATFVVREILGAVRKGEAQRSEFAILFRTATQPRAFEAVLRMAGVPYRLVGGQSFFDRKEVRDVLAYLKLLVNPDDETSLLRVVNTPPRGVGKTAIDRLLAFATSQGISAARALDRIAEVERFPSGALRAINALRATMRGIAADIPRAGVVRTVRNLVEGVNYRAEIERCYEDEQTRTTRWNGVEEVVNFAENYTRRADEPTVLGFLEELSLSSHEDRAEDKSERDAVTLMTVHASKGLEFRNVYIVGLEEGILPHLRSVKDDTVDEERRLMYVAVTRAKQRLTLTFTRERAKYGRRASSMPSRFLFELKGDAPPPAWRPAGAEPPKPPAKRGRRPRAGGRRRRR